MSEPVLGGSSKEQNAIYLLNYLQRVGGGVGGEGPTFFPPPVLPQTSVDTPFNPCLPIEYLTFAKLELTVHLCI
jgi:hypothetical protein